MRVRVARRRQPSPEAAQELQLTAAGGRRVHGGRRDFTPVARPACRTPGEAEREGGGGGGGGG